jgi:hypothetical protein
MSRRRVLAIFRKEMREFRRNNQVISTMALSPIGFLVAPVIFLFEASIGARGLKAAFDIIKACGETPYPRNKAQMSTMPAPMLAFILRSISRSHYRETVGNSAEEARGLIELLTAEAKQKPELREKADAVLALRPRQHAEVSA